MTKDQTISDFIINDLSYEEQFYYEKNFDLINKELLKKVKMPTSKQEFLINLTMVLNSDKHRSSVEAIQAFVPGGPPTPIPAPIVHVPGPPAPVPGPPAPVPGPPAPVPGPPAPVPGPPAPVPGPPVPPGPLIPALRAKTRSIYSGFNRDR